ncbi:MAG: Family ership [Pseudomonadota bacterium]|jgi:glutamate 5-kinase
MSNPRSALLGARRVVIKLGSRLLATRGDLIGDMAAQIAANREPGRDFLVVSSGAISLGCQKLGYSPRPKDMPRLQAAAAAGQSELMRRYSEAFAAHGATVAQVLLTHSDLASRHRLNNAQQALAALFEAGAVPIVNENDTVSTDEIAFGDNDQLASMVVPLVQADLLLLLTDVSGVLGPEGERISVMASDALVGDLSTGNTHGTGGMTSKIGAANKAARSGAHVVITSANEPNILARVLSGEDVGTLFEPHVNKLRARQHWIAYTLKPRGSLMLNAGAVQALQEGTNSLLPVGVVGVAGQFSRGDAVLLLAPDGTEVARGLARLGLSEVARSAGKSTSDLKAQLGELDSVVVHKDDLVLTR